MSKLFIKLPTDVNIEAFIAMIQLHKCLYDKTDKYFRNWDVRDERFTKIGKACNITGDQAKKLWISLRDKFLKEKRRLQVNSNDSTDTSQWEHFTSMGFLDSQNDNITHYEIPKATFIEFIEKNPCLYNRKDKDFRDLALKEKIFEKIAKACNLTLNEAKRKWIFIREKYVKEKRSLSTGEQSNWCYMNNLKFLDPHIQLRKPFATSYHKMSVQSAMALKQRINRFRIRFVPKKQVIIPPVVSEPLLSISTLPFPVATASPIKKSSSPKLAEEKIPSPPPTKRPSISLQSPMPIKLRKLSANSTISTKPSVMQSIARLQTVINGISPQSPAVSQQKTPLKFISPITTTTSPLKTETVVTPSSSSSTIMTSLAINQEQILEMLKTINKLTDKKPFSEFLQYLGEQLIAVDSTKIQQLQYNILQLVHDTINDRKE